MEEWYRETPWRQGHFLTKEAAIKLKLISPENADRDITMVISHDCDIVRDPSIEPEIEVIVGTRIPAADGNCTHSKNPRTLHLSALEKDAVITLEFSARSKRLIGKPKIARFEPNKDLSLGPKELLILQRWLAARYHRAAFPDEFNHRLQETGLEKILMKKLKPLGDQVRAVYFDIDGGENIERKGADDTYALAIYLLYDTSNDPLIAEQVTEIAADAIYEEFCDKFLDRQKDTWLQIELIECKAISDEAMSLAQVMKLKKWNLDHVSFRCEPIQPIFFE